MTSVRKKKTIFEHFELETKEQVFSKILNVQKRNSIKEAYVFGSFATDDFNCDSDIDLIFILDDNDLENIPFIERPLLFSDLTNKNVKIDLLVYSTSEFHKIKNEEKSCFWKSVFKSIQRIL